MAPISSYRAPGVYPDKIKNAGLIQLNAGVRIPVIVGMGNLTREVTVRVEGHTLNQLKPLPPPPGFSKLTIGGVEVVRVGDFPGQAKYKKTTDWLLVQDIVGNAEADFNSPSLTTVTNYPNNVGVPLLSWASTTGSEPPVDVGTVKTVYYVTYKYRVEPSQYKYRLYTDENEILSDYGDEGLIDTDVGNLINVSTGAILALRNGALAVGIIQIDIITAGVTARDTEAKTLKAVAPDTVTFTTTVLKTAFLNTKVEMDVLQPNQLRYIVPMVTSLTPVADIDGIFSDLLDEVDKLSLVNQRQWRMIIRGAPNQTGTANSSVRDEHTQLAVLYNTHPSARRMIVVGPGEVTRTVKKSSNNTVSDVVFDGSVVAAALAGKICQSSNPALSPTNKVFGGFSINRAFSNADMNLIASNGVCLFYTKNGQARCRHALTTDLTDATTQEISVVEIEDYLKNESISVLENSFIGVPLTRETMVSIGATLQSFWDRLVLQNVIDDYDGASISPKVSAADPRAVEVTARVKPVFPLNWIDLTFTFTTGAAKG